MDPIQLPLKPFLFIRHGETDWNREKIYMGSRDIPLNQYGIEQAKLAAQWLHREHIEHIATSPLARAQQTANIIANTVKKPITIISDLQECAWGIQESQPVGNGEILQKWFEGETHEGAESIADFTKRVMNSLKIALALPNPVLIVSHGGVYSVMQRIFAWPPKNLKNCMPIYHEPPKRDNDHWLISEINMSINKD